MKNILSAAGLALAFAVSVSAQATTPSQSSSPAPDQKAHKMSSEASRSVTLSGCVREGAAPDSFELENAAISAPEKAAGTSGAAPAAPAGAAAVSEAAAGPAGTDVGEVKLVATGDINLKEHVGHRVEVTGSLSGKGAPSSSAIGTSGMAGDKLKDARTLRVRSIKHIAETCTK